MNDSSSTSGASGHGSSDIRGFIKRPCSATKAKDITNLIAEMIATDCLPISFVDNEGFRNLMKFLEPGYDVPSRPTITAHLKKLYNTKKQALKEKLAEVEDVALTTDCWTSRNQVGYMTVTAHYLDSGHFLSKVLETYVI